MAKFFIYFIELSLEALKKNALDRIDLYS